MREIKFRAWDTHNKKWTLPLVATSSWITLVEPFNHRKDIRGNLIKIKFMQYTGLKDKNGKEIYERDILEYDFLNDRENGVVEFKGDGWWVSLLASSKAMGQLSYVINYLNPKIIGNIYENPDLLIKTIKKVKI